MLRVCAGTIFLVGVWLKNRRTLGHDYELTFKGDKRLDLDDELAKFKGLGYSGEVVENPRGGTHLKVNIGKWLLQIYGTGTVNAFIRDKKDLDEVWRFLLSLGYTLSLEKVKPTRKKLWDIWDSSEDGKSSQWYPVCFKIIKNLQIIVLKCLLEAH